MVDEEWIVFELIKRIRRLYDDIHRNSDSIEIAIDLHCKIPPQGNPPFDYAYVIIALFFIVPPGPGAKKDDSIRICSPCDDLHNLLDRGLHFLSRGYRDGNVPPFGTCRNC